MRTVENPGDTYATDAGAMLSTTVIFLAGLSMGQTPTASAAADNPLRLPDLARMSRCELETLYRAAPVAGRTPVGFVRGRAFPKAGCPDADRAARRISQYWKGKVFAPCGDAMTNRWAFGLEAVPGRVYETASQFDGRPALAIDYSKTLVWRNVRDELREVAPGLWLGAMHRTSKCGAEFKMFFALEECTAPCDAVHKPIAAGPAFVPTPSPGTAPNGP